MYGEHTARYVASKWWEKSLSQMGGTQLEYQPAHKHILNKSLHSHGCYTLH